MKSKLDQYPEFLAAIQNNELVYLFGAGISSALTEGQSCGWRQWIHNGIGCLKDPVVASSLGDSIKQDASAANLIRVVGEVLKQTKAEGTYHDWMRASFESASVTNDPLAATLRKLLIPQDVFATTNYDLLLEQATGLPTLSYEEPDQAFEMLDHRKSDAVLHLHGVYDSARGLDNIVADQAQYDAVLGDQGAQFVQNILGTRTLVLVGCGQTWEDGNISQFIRFAQSYLKMDRPCFLLHQDGQAPTDLPDHIVPVPYGDQYSDLPLFLEDMAQERLRFRIAKNPLVDRTVYTGKSDAFGLSEYHYASEYLDFCGRTVELARLTHFLETDRPFQWWALTGQGGAGKSRLAFEFLRRSQRDWFGFFLNVDAAEGCAEQFVPFNDTIVVVDYVKGHERQIAKLLSLLIDKFKPLQYKLRLLFLERDNLLLNGSWYDLLLSGMPIAHRSEFLDGAYNTDIVTRKHRFLYLDDLDEAAVVKLIGNICEKKGFPADIARDKRLKEEYGAKFERLRFRPLFLQIFVEAWIDNGCVAVEYESYKSLLEVVVKREQERILQILEGDIAAFNALMLLMIRSSITDGLKLTELERLFPAQWSILRQFAKTHALSGKQRTEYLQTILSDTSQSVYRTETELKPMYPDIIREYMFLFYLDAEDLHRLSKELWDTCPAAYNLFLSRCVMDFQGDTGLIDFVRGESADGKNLNAMQVRWALLEYKVIHSIEEGDFFRQLAVDEYGYWSSVPVEDANRAIVLRGLYHCVWQFFGWSMKQASFEAMDKIRDFPCTTELGVVKARYLTEFAHYLTEKNCFDAARNVIRQADQVLQSLGAVDEIPELRLGLQREVMVLFVHEEKWDEANRLHDQIYAGLDWTGEKAVEQYAYICFSCAALCFRRMQWSHLLTFAFRLQDLAEDYGSQARPICFNDRVHYYYLHTKLMQTEAVLLTSRLQGMGAYGLGITDALIDEIQCNTMIADFAGLLVGAKALKVGSDENVTDGTVEGYFQEAAELLERYPDNALLAEKAIDLWRTAFAFQFRKQVPKEYVQKAYALALRFCQNGDVLEEFFQLLKESTEAGNWRDYTKRKGIADGLIQANLTEYLYPPDSETAPLRRQRQKISPNAPCPCGSGRKFKKCCRGNGRYD